jgi:hypothetical protein
VPAPQPGTVVVPKTAEHSAYVIEVNGKGQVSKVRSSVSSGNQQFDAMTYGNVIQTFVRKPDGTAVAGVYRMNYDYDPKTKNVKRSVTLLQTGGVNANAVGLVDRMAEANKVAAEKVRKAMEARNKPVENVPLPFLSPTPAPKHS